MLGHNAHRIVVVYRSMEMITVHMLLTPLEMDKNRMRFFSEVKMTVKLNVLCNIYPLR